MTVVFLTSRHIPGDDRIFHHLAVTLAEAGYDPVVISSRGGEQGKKQGVQVDSFDGRHMDRKARKQKFYEILGKYRPAVVIGADPFSVHIAWHFRKNMGASFRIIYDITEWYPSKKELLRHALPARIFLFPGYLFYNLLAGHRAGAFLFGEWYKSRPFRILFPRKEYLFVGYYPRLRYIPFTQAAPPGNVLHLSYSGKLSREKGFGRFLEVVERMVQKRPGLKVKAKVVGWYADGQEKNILEKKIAALPGQVQTEFFPYLAFPDFLQTISDTDLFLDLRDDDPENRHCLPIKIFYYAAYGRPVIYSDLKAIRREAEVERFGYLVKPDNTEQVVSLLEQYLEDPELYLRHCREARRLAEERYNWDMTGKNFISFLEKTGAS